MNVYILKADPNGFQGLVADNKATWRKVLFSFDGRTMSGEWTPPKLRIYPGDIADRKPAGDFPNLISFIPVFSERALNVLVDLLADSGEVLPLLCSEGSYYAFNVTRIIDALDESSSFERFESSGRVFGILHHQFITKRVEGLVIFKMPYMHKSNVYVTDCFVDRVREQNLSGFLFKKVWSNEDS